MGSGETTIKWNVAANASRVICALHDVHLSYLSDAVALVQRRSRRPDRGIHGILGMLCAFVTLEPVLITHSCIT